jgi:protoporphyrinogen oxidase
MTRKRLAILGTGMAGFGASHRLREEQVEVVLYEKNSYYGGHTASHRVDPGFTFDEGPHVSFTTDERIQNLLAENVEGKFETIQYQVNNYWRGHWVTHPVQNHLHGLPTDLVVSIIRDFAALQEMRPAETHNYEDWLLGSYGKTFATTFPMVYTEKYHTTSAANMTTEWIGPRMYRPSLEEVIRGAVSPVVPNVHYVTHFRYPTTGGFMTYLKPFADQGKIVLDHKVVGLDPVRRELRFSNGETALYDGVISSIPLPDLIPLIEGVPDDILKAAQKLAYSSCVLVNIGVNRPNISDAHISYFYDHDIVFTRLSFPHRMSPNNVPLGASSVQAELYFSNKYKPVHGSLSDYIDPVIHDLRRCGLLHADDQILCKTVKLCRYANVIFDHDRSPSLKMVHRFLDEVGVGYCGRYGDWSYLWTDESFKSGENAAQKILDKF